MSHRRILVHFATFECVNDRVVRSAITTISLEKERTLSNVR